MEGLLEIDQAIFFWINHNCSSDAMDRIVPLLRNKYTWIPLYVAILAFVALNFGKKVWWFLLFSLLTVSLSDTMSSKLVKPTVKRDRPCHTFDEVKLLIRCGSGYSFTSSHATNHFALGTFFFLSLGFAMKRWKYLFLLWALVISLSQIYVGVHYPLDILGGAFLGVFCGMLVHWIFQRKTKFQSDLRP